MSFKGRVAGRASDRDTRFLTKNGLSGGDPNQADHETHGNHNYPESGLYGDAYIGRTERDDGTYEVEGMPFVTDYNHKQTRSRSRSPAGGSRASIYAGRGTDNRVSGGRSRSASPVGARNIRHERGHDGNRSSYLPYDDHDDGPPGYESYKKGPLPPARYDGSTLCHCNLNSTSREALMC